MLPHDATNHRHWTQKLRAASLLLWLMLLLTLAQCIVAVVPFKYLAAWMRGHTAEALAPADLVRSLRRKIVLAAHWLPWHPACLPQALAGRFVLHRRGYQSALILGVSLPDDAASAMTAHAWLLSGDQFVAGRASYDRYREVARF